MVPTLFLGPHQRYETETPTAVPLCAGDAGSVGGDARAAAAERGHAQRHQGDQGHAARGGRCRAAGSHLQHGGAETLPAGPHQHLAPGPGGRQEKAARLMPQPASWAAGVRAFSLAGSWRACVRVRHCLVCSDRLHGVSRLRPWTDREVRWPSAMQTVQGAELRFGLIENGCLSVLSANSICVELRGCVVAWSVCVCVCVRRDYRLF